MAALGTWALAVGLLGAVVSSAALFLGVPARFLVWGTVGHISLLVVSAALGLRTRLGFEAAVPLAVSLVLGNGLAWLGWRRLRGAAKSADLGPARGQARRIPAAGAAFVAGALASAGMPLSPGFFGRVLLFLAAAKVGGAAGWLAIAVCGLQSLAWILCCAMAMRVFFLDQAAARPVRQPGAASRWLWGALAGLSLLAGLLPGPLAAIGTKIANLANVAH